MPFNANKRGTTLITAHEPPGLMGAKTLSHKMHNMIKANQENHAQMRQDSLGAGMSLSERGVVMGVFKPI